MTYKTTQDLDTWPFTVDVNGYFGEESTEDRYVKLNTKARETELYKEITFLNMTLTQISVYYWKTFTIKIEFDAQITIELDS